MATKQFIFTSDQRRELEQQDLLPEQIDELRSRLPGIRAWQAKPPPRAKVRDHIHMVSKPLQQALEALRILDSAAFPDDGPEGPSIRRLSAPAFRPDVARARPAREALEAYDRLVERGDTPNVRTVLTELVAQVADIEQRVMAGGQNRPAAPWQAINLIVDALLMGFIKHHHARGVGLVRHSDDAPFNPLPAFDPPTVSTAGRFGRITAICYEAAGLLESPDKAIRAYQAREDRRQQQRVEQRRQENPTLPPSEKYREIDLAVSRRARGRPRKKK